MFLRTSFGASLGPIFFPFLFERENHVTQYSTGDDTRHEAMGGRIDAALLDKYCCPMLATSKTIPFIHLPDIAFLD